MVSILGFILSLHNIQMDPEKVVAVKNWSVPENRWQLQQFLGFINFSRKFFHNYRSIAAPLHQLMLVKHPFLLSPEAQQAFSHLRNRFTSAPVLTLPDAFRQFVVEA